MKSVLAKHFTARLGMAGAFASAMLFAAPLLAQNSRLSLADRVSRLEQQAQSQNQGGTGMVNQVQQLQSQVQQLQGQLEELQHQLQQLQDTNKAQYIDLDSRLGRLEGNGGAATNSAAGANAAPASSGSSAAAATPANAASAPAAAPAEGSGNGPTAAPDANAQAAYDAAFKALRGGDYAQASRGFRTFIQQYPDNALTSNAWYWLGESYYVTMNYPVALEAFQRLLSQFPQSEKAPDALLKVGYSQLELKQLDAGKATLQAVTTKYPDSRAASLAQERLRRLQLQSAIR
jgi:tol-pal system protein YbgF